MIFENLFNTKYHPYLKWNFNKWVPIVASGCPDVTPPESAWVKRDGDNLVIRCNNTGETWYLTCKDEEWVGDYSNCTGRSLLTNRAKGKTNFLQEGENHKKGEIRMDDVEGWICRFEWRNGWEITGSVLRLLAKGEIFVSKNNITEDRLIVGCEKMQFNETLVSGKNMNKKFKRRRGEPKIFASKFHHFLHSAFQLE